jgi:GTPase Era involved in 16S rRNA processing
MFSRFVQSEAFASTHEAQVILYMLDATKLSKKFNEKKKDEVIYSIKELPSENIPIIILLNKVDLVKDKTQLLPLIEFASKVTKTGLCIPISAKTGDGSDLIIDEILKYLPEMDRLYSKDFITLLRERDMVSEIIREKVMLYCHQEIPYSTAVTIDNFNDTRPESADESVPSELSENIVHVKKTKSQQNISNPISQKNLPQTIPTKEISIQNTWPKNTWPKKIWPKKIWIDATIHVEKSSQKKIIIGAHGSGIKHIGQQARADIEELLQHGVMLKLFVRVDPNWKMQTSRLKEFGYASSP